MMTRRWFLSVLLAAGASAAGWAAEVAPDPNLVVLFADTHCTAQEKNTHQREGLARCVREVLALNPRPAHVLLYGDLSFGHGETNDYRVLKALLGPLEAAGVRWHACFGNHDRRGPFGAVFPEAAARPQVVAGRQVTVVETPHADFILLDSCLEGPVNGGLDEAQRAWLAETLRGYAKPVFVGAHHPLKETGVGGLLAATPWCKGYIYGHRHTWQQQAEEGVETLCLPSTGHWGDIGYVLVRLSAEEAVFTLRQHDFYAPRPGEAKPEWQARIKRNDGSRWRVPLKSE